MDSCVFVEQYGHELCRGEFSDGSGLSDAVGLYSM